jgi:hypothetical protein
MVGLHRANKEAFTRNVSVLREFESYPCLKHLLSSMNHTEKVKQQRLTLATPDLFLLLHPSSHVCVPYTITLVSVVLLAFRTAFLPTTTAQPLHVTSRARNDSISHHRSTAQNFHNSLYLSPHTSSCLGSRFTKGITFSTVPLHVSSTQPPDEKYTPRGLVSGSNNSCLSSNSRPTFLV